MYSWHGSFGEGSFYGGNRKIPGVYFKIFQKKKKQRGSHLVVLESKEMIGGTRGIGHVRGTQEPS